MSTNEMKIDLSSQKKIIKLIIKTRIVNIK